MAGTDFGSAEPVGAADTSATAEPKAPAAETPQDSATDTALDLNNLNFGQKPEVKEWAEKIGVKTVESAIAKAYEAEKLVGQKQIGFPDANSTPEERDAFFKAAGWPGEAKAYTEHFKLPDDLPDNFPYDEKARDQFADWANEAHLSPEQAALLHDKFVQSQAAGFVTMTDAQAQTAVEAEETLTQTLTAATDTLAKEFNAKPGSDAFNAHVNHALRFVQENGGDALKAEMVEQGVFHQEESGVLQVKAPRLVAAMAKAGEALYAEDGPMAGSGPGAKDNPWKEGPTHNVTKQHQLVRDDPARAKRLKALAGVRE